jgi:membrane-associated phospholipid phosphatase
MVDAAILKRRSGSQIAPAEWVTIAFLSYAALRMLFAGKFLLAVTTIPRTDAIFVLVAVAVVRLVLTYRKLPWGDTPRVAVVMHHVMAVVLLLPALFTLLFRRDLWPTEYENDAITQAMLRVHAWTTHIAQLFMPALFLWLAAGIQVKKEGRLSIVSLVRNVSSSVWHAVRDLLPPMVLIYSYGLMGAILSRPLVADQDARLASIDRFLFGGNDPIDLLQHVTSRALSQWLSIAYVSYAFFFPVVLGAIYARGSRKGFREVALATTLALAIGYIVYTIVPAQGPLFVKHFDVDLEHYQFRFVQEQLMDKTRIPRDCFPSLHTALTLVLTWGAYRHARVVFWILLPFAVSIPFACVYLRYHYAVDVLAGLTLFAGTTWATPRLQARFDPVLRSLEATGAEREG